MGFIDSVSCCLNKYTVFSGRATRSEYWWMYLFNILTQLLVAVIFGVAAFFIGGGVSAIVGAYVGILVASALLIIPSIAVTVRRLHDTGRSGWWYFICFVPFIGSIWFLILMLSGSDDQNEYGYPPY